MSLTGLQSAKLKKKKEEQISKLEEQLHWFSTMAKLSKIPESTGNLIRQLHMRLKLNVPNRYE